MTRSMNKNSKIALLFGGALVGLAGCGSNACTGLDVCPDGPTYVTFADSTSSVNSDLSGHVLTTSTRTSQKVAGTLDRANNTASIAGASGTINATRTMIDLAVGGSVSLNANAINTHAVRYAASPIPGERTTGVIGIATQTTDMPSRGSASYTGDAQVTIQDGVDLFDLHGTSVVAANFSTGSVSTTLSALNGTKVPGFGATETASNVATITITGSSVSGNGFSGGSAGVNSSNLTTLTSGARTQIGGTFYGARAAETGGTFVINDSANGGILALGDFLAKR